MTHLSLKHGVIAIAAATLTFSASSAMAADVTPQAQTQATFTAKSAADTNIRLSAKAFRTGDFQRSVKYSKMALKSSISNKRAAIAQSNLCAAHAKLGQMSEASAACTAALELRPNYTPAINNKAALTIRLAQK